MAAHHLPPSSTAALTLLSLPEELQVRVLSFVPRRFHCTVLVALPVLRPAFLALPRSLLREVDLQPTDAVHVEAPAFIPYQHATLLSTLRFSAGDLRVLRLHAAVPSATTMAILAAARAHCPNIARLTFCDTGEVDATFVASLLAAFSSLAHLAVIDPGSRAIQVVMQELCKHASSLLNPELSVRSLITPPSVAFLTTRTTMLQTLRSQILKTNHMTQDMGNASGRQHRGRAQPLRAWLDLTVALATTGCDSLDVHETATLLRMIITHGKKLFECVRRFELHILSHTFKNEAVRNLVKTFISTETPIGNSLPDFTELQLKVQDRLCFTLSPFVSNFDVDLGEQQQRHQQIGERTIHYERLLHEHRSRGRFDLNKLSESTGVQIYQRELNLPEFGWPETFSFSEVEAFHSFLRRHIASNALESVQFNFQAQSRSSNFEHLHYAAKLAVQWAHRILVDFPSVKILLLPRTLMLSLGNPFVYSLFRACENIKQIYFLRLVGDNPQNGSVGRSRIAMMRKEIVALRTFVDFIIEYCPNLRRVYVEEAMDRMLYTCMAVRTEVIDLHTTIERVESKRPELDLSTFRNQVEAWMI